MSLKRVTTLLNFKQNYFVSLNRSKYFHTVSSTGDKLSQTQFAKFPTPNIITKTKSVCGTWQKDFEFRLIESSAELPIVLEALRDFAYLGTPLTAGLTYSKEYFEECDQVHVEAISQGISLCVVDRNNNKVAGLGIFCIRSEAEELQPKFHFKSPQKQIQLQILNTVEKSADIYRRYGISSFFYFLTGCVDPKYRNQGLCEELTVRGVDLAISLKCTTIMGDATSAFSRKCFQKLGFEEIASARFNDFKSEDGTPLLIGRGDDEHVAIVCLRIPKSQS